MRYTLDPQTRELLRRQIELEDEQRSLGVSRYNSRKMPWKVEAGTPEEEANLPPGQHLLREVIEPVAEAIKEAIADACSGKAGRRHSAMDFLLLCEPDEVAYLTVRTMLNHGVVGGNPLVATSRNVAEALLDNLQFKAFREINRKGYKGYMKKQEARGYSRQRRAAVKKLFDAEGVTISLNPQEQVVIGSRCIEIAAEATGLFVLDTEKRAKGHTLVLRVTETLQTWLDQQHDRCALLAPVNLPMVCRPRRWRTPTYGGYLTPRHGNRFIKQRNRAYHDEIRNMDLTKLYDAVNHIQDTPWRINTKVLAVMEQAWADGTSLGGLAQRNDDPIPAKPDDFEFNEEAKTEWKRAAAQVHQINADRMSERMAVQQGLWVGRRFAEEEAIYFPHELDFRGRVYPIPTYGPSPQGSDWQKALIHFADGKPLGLDGFRWLQIHIANLFGVDKVSFDDRLAWVLENTDALIDSGRDPLDGQRFWTTADSPYCALAACIEFAEALAMDDPTAYVSRVPVALDGSCSGLQHFSAMLRDEAGGRAVNLLPSDKPQDIYSEVAAFAQARADSSTDENGLVWAGGKVTRKIAKRPTMTFCYSATRFGMQGMILQTLNEIDRDNAAKGEEPHLGGADNYHAAVWLSHVLFEAIENTVTAAAQAMDWLRDAARVASEAALPLWWGTPMGMPVLQEYRSLKGKRVDAHWGGRMVRLRVNVEGDLLDKRSQANGVAPNYVHSLDASHLQSVALRCREGGIRHLAMIHDSFGTHAADTDRLSAILRDTFIEQYEGDVLGDFYRELQDQLGEELAAKLPPPPQSGTLDLGQLRDALYSFA